MAKKTTKSSTKKTVKTTVNTEPKKIAKSTAKVNSVSKQDSTKTVIDEIKIGDQTWTSKNLDVSTYRNGDVIPQVQNEEEWSKLTTGAWCYYENETANGTTYGKLYNWYAVNDSRGLAPKGYHVPTDAEWTILTDNLGGTTEACTKMKSTSGWKEDGNGNNSSGFNGLPGGCRLNTGDFFFVGSYGEWWSSSEINTDEAGNVKIVGNASPSSCLKLMYDYGKAIMRYEDKQNGFSVRCLRD